MRQGDTLYNIGQLYNVDYRNIAYENKIPIDEPLVVGQTIVILTNNDKKFGEIEVNGYAFPNINIDILTQALPYLTYLSIFSYSVNDNGSLNMVDDEELISFAKSYQTVPIMVVTNINLEKGRFDSDLAHVILSDKKLQDELITSILNVMQQKSYGGLNLDFEYVYPEDKDAYMHFIAKVKKVLLEYGYFLVISVAPKTSSEQEGILYEAHDYEQIGFIADIVVIMTYEWGYSGGPAMAVAPINKIEQVLDYAVEKIPPDKILMGIPNYGYDWTLPYQKGTLAKSIGNYEAVNLARIYNRAINYDYTAQASYFNYYDLTMLKHEVWFEDARSIQAKLELVLKYKLRGVSYWTLNREFPQNYLVLGSMFQEKKYLSE